MSQHFMIPLSKRPRRGDNDNLTSGARSAPIVGQSTDAASAARARDAIRGHSYGARNTQPACCTALQIQVEYLKNQLSGANMNKEINCLKNIIKQQAKELVLEILVI